MDYNSRKNELFSKQEKVMKKYKELLTETSALVTGMMELYLSEELTVDEISDWFQYMAGDEVVDKTFRLSAALLYVETPNDFDVVKTLKNDMKMKKIKVKKNKINICQK